MRSPKPVDSSLAFEAALSRILDEHCPSADDAARNKLLEHYQLLVEWNRRLNLTRVTEPIEAARKHFGESLFLAAHLPAEVKTIVDVGSGAGFPGLPIAAVRPDIRVTCVESVSKKATFVREASRGWGNVKVLDRRIEEVVDAFDWAIMRAVAIETLLPKLSELAPRLALLAAERSCGTIDGADDWRVVSAKPLPWAGAGVLVLAEQA